MSDAPIQPALHALADAIERLSLRDFTYLVGAFRGAENANVYWGGLRADAVADLRASP